MGILRMIIFNHFIMFIVKYMVILFFNDLLHKAMIRGSFEVLPPTST